MISLESSFVFSAQINYNNLICKTNDNLYPEQPTHLYTKSYTYGVNMHDFFNSVMK